MICTSLKNEFPGGKYVWAQQTKLYVRLLPENSIQYFLNKKLESKSILVTYVLHFTYAEKASQSYDTAKVVHSVTVKRTNELAFPEKNCSKKARITFLSEVSSTELKHLLMFKVLPPV